MLPRERPLQQLALHLAEHLELISSAAGPRPRRLTRTGVVVLNPLADRLQVVIRLPRPELPDREHPPHSAAPRPDGGTLVQVCEKFSFRG